MTESPNIPRSGRVLGIDWGANRIGVAISDETQLLATPLAVFTRRTGRRLPLGDFLNLVESEHPVGLVVGLPLDDFGKEGDSAIQARAMGESFGERASLPIAFIDESFSTTESLDRLTSRGLSPTRKRDSIDAMAAAIVLERWIAERRASLVEVRQS
jgi:putative Holliday junction resolvase